MANLGNVAGIVAGFKAGEITEATARRLLREFGTGDNVVDGLLAAGAGLAAGLIVGDVVSDAVGSLFDNVLDDLF